MELTVYETFEDFKENYLNDLPAYQGDLLEYLKEYLVLYNDIFAESDKLSEYFHPRDEDDKSLPEYPEIVYAVNRKMFDLELRQRDNYLKNSYSEEINETLYQFLLFYERVYAFLEKEIQRVEIELKFIKQWGPGGFQQTAPPVDPEPDNREQEMFRKSAKQYDDSLFLSNEASEFVYCVLSRFEEEIRNKATKTSHVNWIFDRCCNNIDKDLKKVPGIFRPVTKAEFLKKFSTSVQKTFDSIGQRDKREQIFMEEYNAMLLKID